MVKIMSVRTAMNRHRLIASLSSACTSIASGEEMSTSRLVRHSQIYGMKLLIKSAAKESEKGNVSD